MKYRACEVCGQTDIETFVVSSTIGPMSCNYCSVCAAMGAEPKGLEEFAGDYVIYDSLTDSYMFGGKVREIVLKSGEKFKTRKEYLDFQSTTIIEYDNSRKSDKKRFIWDDSWRNCEEHKLRI